ncbi:NiFe hydrogenase [Shewanella xiamenensis]|uniref:NiFe hydrogenase n=1 Tax=Shewanella xiamenensis TaxID=332186 RepID=UPI000D64B24F|nr:NiFe hydrogenase [Shewanella xiamenensis]MCT8857456.1 NiFe hydrogenase [Shewanella xiamenensis]MDH1626505.1 NiFe hydrogenase [Shewanella xiamenensis]MDV5248788.1 NiFe hydrogenase [Shewanella xiamenensis]PWH03544.1 NiFe hydrogenase [Shewanella xiamenensis]UWG66526.1 NiFe hydrogenase [Shewanella xiamenensis]
MKNIRFDFTCSRQVPLYAHLCNEYLNYDALNISIGCDNHNDFGPQTYFIEAQGEQAPLEQLADAIAADFLMSVWLVDSGIKVIDEPQGQRTFLETQEPQMDKSVAAFCQQCYPLFGDNQAAQFGAIDLTCSCCHGETRLTPAQKALTLTDLKAMAEQLITQGSLALSCEGIELSLEPFARDASRPQLLICNPNTLNAHFCLKDHQVVALSSIEKPLICARPIQDHQKLFAPLYDICFGYSRVVAVLSEILRQKGIDWVYLQGQHHRPKLAWVDGAWAQLSHQDGDNANNISKHFNAPEPLREEIRFLGFTAQWQAHKKTRSHQGTLSVQVLSSVEKETNYEGDQEDHTITDAALFAALLNGKFTSHKQAKNAAVIYLSHDHPSQIVTCDNKGDTSLFFALPELPDNGYDIFHRLDSSPQKAVAQKFKSLFPEDYLKLLSLKLHGRRDNLQSLWAIAAILIGLNPQEETQSQDYLSDALMAAAMRYQGANAPRIDYPLTKGEAHRSLSWCKTLGTLLSFRVAGHSDPSQLAFAMQDSLADYLANWLEHIDLNIGVQTIALAGNELANETLCKRMSLRLGKNFPLLVNRSLDLEGDNLAVGALYVKQRQLNTLG